MTHPSGWRTHPETAHPPLSLPTIVARHLRPVPSAPVELISPGLPAGVLLMRRRPGRHPAADHIFCSELPCWAASNTKSEPTFFPHPCLGLQIYNYSNKYITILTKAVGIFQRFQRFLAATGAFKAAGQPTAQGCLIFRGALECVTRFESLLDELPDHEASHQACSSAGSADVYCWTCACIMREKPTNPPRKSPVYARQLQEQGQSTLDSAISRLGT